MLTPKDVSLFLYHTYTQTLNKLINKHLHKNTLMHTQIYKPYVYVLLGPLMGLLIHFSVYHVMTMKVRIDSWCLCFPQVSRVLKPGGRFISVTFAQPHFRKRLYARAEYGWSIKHHHYGNSFHYFLYVLTKGEELSPEDAALERRMLAESEAPPSEVTFQEVDSEHFLNNIGL